MALGPQLAGMLTPTSLLLARCKPHRFLETSRCACPPRSARRSIFVLAPGASRPRSTAWQAVASPARPAWQEHSAFFEREFSKLNLRQLAKLHDWQETNLPESLQPIPVVFYMFSGPDFLYVDQFFPHASVYVLCGKEGLGPPPDPLRIANLSGALGNLENAMRSSLSTTYFITKDMKVDLHAQNLNGVLPIFYTFLARAGKSAAERFAGG